MLMTYGNAALLGDLRDRGRLTGIERADQKLGAFVDQLLGLRASDLNVGLGVAVHDLQRWQARILEQAGSDVDAALAILTDAGLEARTRQQHADLQRRALRAPDAERRGAGDDTGGTKTDREGAARDARMTRFDGHLLTPP